MIAFIRCQVCRSHVSTPMYTNGFDMDNSHLARRLYANFIDTIEPFGAYENWLSIPYGEGDVDGADIRIAEEIRNRVHEEIG